MNPKNINVLKNIDINYVSLSNNHVLDWKYEGLDETMKTLNENNIKYSGCGKNICDAQKPAIFKIKNKGRVIVFSFGTTSAGIYKEWEATEDKAGVFLIKLNKFHIDLIADLVKKEKKENDIVICSIHWGSNWGYDIEDERIDFAHNLIDVAGVDLIHGHSSHHPLGIEVYKKKLILYGCGDIINDYEGIESHEEFRSELSFMYFPLINCKNGELIELILTPTLMKNMRLNKPDNKDVKFLLEKINSVSFNLKFEITENERIKLII